MELGGRSGEEDEKFREVLRSFEKFQELLRSSEKFREVPRNIKCPCVRNVGKLWSTSGILVQNLVNSLHLKILAFYTNS